MKEWIAFLVRLDRRKGTPFGVTARVGAVVATAKVGFGAGVVRSKPKERKRASLRAILACRNASYSLIMGSSVLLDMVSLHSFPHCCVVPQSVCSKWVLGRASVTSYYGLTSAFGKFVNE